MNTMTHVYNTHVQNQIADLLIYFDENLITDTVNTAILQRCNFDTCIPGVNLAESLEQRFKYSIANIDSESRELMMEKRDKIYTLIIDIICKQFNFTFTNYNMIDKYALAYYMYEFFISDFKNKLILFYTNFIYKEKNNIYANHLVHLKKDKNSSMVYGKKMYKNTKLATINANMDYIVSNISYYDISFEEILNNIYIEKQIIQLFIENIIPNSDFYKIFYGGLFNTTFRHPIVNQIRLLFHSYAINEQ